MSDTLPLTPFEELMLHQDSSAYPATCFLKLIFSGRLDRTAFDTAIQKTVRRHPLLHATVEKQKRCVWHIGEVATKIHWTDEQENVAPDVDQIDLCTEQGIRFFIQLSEDSSEVLIQFHHACCDGIAIYQVVRDLLIEYAAKFSDDAKLRPPPLRHELLADRGATGLPLKARLKLAGQQLARVPAVCNFFRRTPATLTHSQPLPFEAPAPKPFPTLFSFHFDKSTSAELRSQLRSGTTLNDLLTRDLFLALRDFRSAQKANDDSKWLRLMIPISLRRTEQFRASAANMIGAVFLDRRSIGMRNPDEMLRGIQREMDQIKRLKLGHLFNFALGAQRSLPGGLRSTARPSRCETSAVFTNIGRVLPGGPVSKIDGRWQCGNAVLMSTAAAAPITRNVSVSFSATWYANRLSLTLHADPRALSPQSAKSMLNLFVQHVQNSAGTRPTTAPKPTFA